MLVGGPRSWPRAAMGAAQAGRVALAERLEAERRFSLPPPYHPFIHLSR